MGSIDDTVSFEDPNKLGHDMRNLLTGIVGNSDILKIELERDDESYPKVQAISQYAHKCIELSDTLRKTPFNADTIQAIDGIAEEMDIIMVQIASTTSELRVAQERNENVRRYLSEIDIAYNRCRMFLSELQGKAKHVVKDLDVNVIATEVVHELFQRANFKVELNLQARNFVSGYDLYLYQIIENLVSNAKYAAENNQNAEPKVSISTLDLPVIKTAKIGNIILEQGNYVVLAVKDTGEGIPYYLAKRIFERHFTTKGEKGTGEGLDTVNKARLFHNARLYITSNYKDGTCFEVIFHASQKQVLVVDNEPQIGDIACRFLHEYGHQAHYARSSEEALQHRGMDVVLLDNCLPENSVGQIYALNPDAAFIAFSGSPSPSAKHYLPKPFNKEQMADIVRETCVNRPT